MKYLFPAVAFVLGLSLIFSGALVTSNQPGLLIGSRGHLILAAASLLAVLPLARQGWGRIALAILVVDAAITVGVTSAPLATPVALLHAILAPAYIASLAQIGWFSVWDRPGPAIDSGYVSRMKNWLLVTPAFVLAQISMGAGYRHKVLGVLPHMGGALIVALFLLIVPVVLLQRFPDHPTLKPAATLAMAVVLLQIALGIGAFVMRLLDFDKTPVFVYLAAGHVTVGSVVLTASLVLALEVRRTATGSGPQERPYPDTSHDNPSTR